MVNIVLKSVHSNIDTKKASIQISEFKWSSVSLEEVLAADTRLEAAVFGIEGRQAREIIRKCKWPIKTICGSGGLAIAYHRPRFKRIYVNKSDYPIYQPSQINEIYPKPSDYISNKTKVNLDSLRVYQNQILMTCSGTVGNCTIVSKTLADKLFSHDLIRIETKNKYDIGYLYAFLKSKVGHALIVTNNYGAVISHIEPDHLSNVQIPDPSPILKKEIHDLIEKSFHLRDESNELINDAHLSLKVALNLTDIESFKPKYFNDNAHFKNFEINVNQLNNRLDASYHVPVINNILKSLSHIAKEVTTVGDVKISKKILMPGIFKRTYVDEGQGQVFIGGKNLLELDPGNKKYISIRSLNKKLQEQLIIRENMVLISSRGTVGNVNIVPKHWDGWTASNNTVHIIPKSNNIAGFLYAWLSSEYAYPLIVRETYGSVVDMIDENSVSNIPVPLLSDTSVQQDINDKILVASQKRFEAYELERKALKVLEEKVIYAS